MWNRDVTRSVAVKRTEVRAPSGRGSSLPVLDAVDDEDFLADPFHGFDLQARGFLDVLNTDAIRHGRRIAATEDQRAEREINLVDEILANQRRVQFTAAFAKQIFDLPLLA